MRGFVLDQLGTDDTLNDQGFPTGGNGLIVINSNSARLTEGVGARRLHRRRKCLQARRRVEPRRLRPAAGFGLRYRSPI